MTLKKHIVVTGDSTDAAVAVLKKHIATNGMGCTDTHHRSAVFAIMAELNAAPVIEELPPHDPDFDEMEASTGGAATGTLPTNDAEPGHPYDDFSNEKYAKTVKGMKADEQRAELKRVSVTLGGSVADNAETRYAALTGWHEHGRHEL